MKIFILGINGMLGNTLIRHLSYNKNLKLFGSINKKNGFLNKIQTDNIEIVYNLDIFNTSFLEYNIKNIEPNIIINCVGLIKQNSNSKDMANIIYVNSFFPHILKNLCEQNNIRLIHISTDCVFSGRRGNYSEIDVCDCEDYYGKTKYLGELSDSEIAITLRTSLIGHEIVNKRNLLEWFLMQTNEVKGFSQAIFSGLTTLEISKVIDEYIIPNPQMTGLYHLSSNAIDKYNLLKLISKIYKKNIKIISDSEYKINRSLDSSIFKSITSWNPPSWVQMVEEMYKDSIYYKNNNG